MKYSVGYKISRNNGLVNKIIECKESISEVYFSWGGFPNGRNNQLKTDGFTPWQAQQKQMEDLKILTFWKDCRDNDAYMTRLKDWGVAYREIGDETKKNN